MKILHYKATVWREQGGVVGAVLALCAELARAGHEVTLASYDPRDVPQSWFAGGPGLPRVLRVPSMRFPAGLLGRGVLAGAVAQSDIVHLHSMWQLPTLRIGAVCRRLGTPYVVSIHGMLDDWTITKGLLKKRVFLGAGGRRWLERAGAVHCTAEAELAQSAKWFPRGRGVVAPLFLEWEPYERLPGPEIARSRWPSLSRGPSVLFLSRLHPKKGVELLLGAMGALWSEGSPARLLIAGTGETAYEAALRRLAAPHGDKVEFLGFVSGEAKISLLQAADVFALASYQENFGYALFEALAAGTPVVTSRDVDTWRELVASGGAVAAERTPAAFAAAIREVLENPARREEMGRAGRQWAVSNLRPGVVIARYEEMYRDAMRRQA
ncbi:MAG TPA: glycosyltransferase [Phycisphaerales bacterium]|nr:glycosyltransferase [Phycisphaerales bacterium]